MPIPGAVPASMGKRLLAFVIDQVALLVLGGGFTVAGLLPLLSDPAAAASPGPLLLVGAVLALLLGLFQWWYQGSRGYTLGKRAVGLRTLGADDGRPVGLGRALVRLLVVAAGSLAFGVGQLVVLASPLFDSSGRRQGWHDKAAGTMVFDVAVGLDPMIARPGIGAPEVARRLDSLLGSAGASRTTTHPAGDAGQAWPPAPAPATTTTTYGAAGSGLPVPDPGAPAPEPAAPAPRAPYFAVAAQAAAAAAAERAAAERAAAASEGAESEGAEPETTAPETAAPETAAPAAATPETTAPAAVAPAPVVPRATPHAPVSTVVPGPGVIHAVPVAPTAAVVPPPADLPPDVEATRLRPARAKVPEALVVPDGPPTATIELTDGRRLSVTGTALVGRNPGPRPGEVVDQLVTVPDPGRSVSKTHLSVGVDEAGVWVRDRNSTNGTVVTLADGQQILCAPEQHVRVPAGASVAFGDYGIVVVDAPSGRVRGGPDAS